MISIDRLRKIARMFNAKGIVMKELMEPKRNNGVFEPQKFSKRLKTESLSVDGFASVTVWGENFGGKHVLFLHGGSYVSEGLVFHRRIVEKLALDYGFRVTYVDYPLAPEHDAIKTHVVVRRTFDLLRERFAEDAFIVMGDSAGGGLALSFMQTLVKSSYKPLPEALVLISPWLDISMSNPNAFIYEQKDPTLSVAGLLYAGKRYAGELDVRDPLVSPIFGDLSHLGRVFVSVGTDELFYPDCRDFFDRCRAEEGTEMELLIFEEMFHDFVMTPIKASKEALDLISLFLSGASVAGKKGVRVVGAKEESQ